MSQIATEFQAECQSLVANVALHAAESMPLSQRVMIYRGVTALLPAASEASRLAEKAYQALSEADRNQLRLFEILTSAPTQTPAADQ